LFAFERFSRVSPAARAESFEARLSVAVVGFFPPRESASHFSPRLSVSYSSYSAVRDQRLVKAYSMS
jgi:hypothetical protein